MRVKEKEKELVVGSMVGFEEKSKLWEVEAKERGSKNSQSSKNKNTPHFVDPA